MVRRRAHIAEDVDPKPRPLLQLCEWHGVPVVPPLRSRSPGFHAVFSTPSARDTNSTGAGGPRGVTAWKASAWWPPSHSLPGCISHLRGAAQPDNPGRFRRRSQRLEDALKTAVYCPKRTPASTATRRTPDTGGRHLGAASKREQTSALKGSRSMVRAEFGNGLPLYEWTPPLPGSRAHSL